MKYYKVLTPFHKMKVEKKKKIRIAGSLSGNLLRTSYGRFRGEIYTMGFGSAYLQIDDAFTGEYQNKLLTQELVHVKL